MRNVLLIVGALYCGLGAAADPRDFLAAYAEQAKQADAAFQGFSAERGRAFYFRRHKTDDGLELSCASCHHADPRTRTVAHLGEFPCRTCHTAWRGPSDKATPIERQIAPMAPSANPHRFTQEEKVEAWFGWNCRLLLKRECTPVEKGDLITWLFTFN